MFAIIEQERINYTLEGSDIMNLPQQCIFDMDGLLIDSETQPLEAHRLTAEEFGLALTRDQYLKTIGMNIMGSDQYLQELFPELDVQRFRTRMTVLKDELNESLGIPLKPGVLEILDYLESKGIAKTVATSTHRSRAERVLTHHDILRRFDGIVCGDDITHSKPHPEIMELSLAITGARPENALVFEDSYNGIQAANNAGIPVIMIPDLLPANPELYTTAVMADLFEAIEFLKQLK